MAFDPELPRCPWPGRPDGNSLMLAWHDTEWGVPVHDDRRHFEYLVLGVFQAGLSWATVLNRRERFRRAFDGFDPARVARYTPRRIESLLGDTGIIRNRQKIEATIGNARRFLAVQEREESFDAFIWQFVGGRPRHNRWRLPGQLPAITKQSDAMSRALRALGFGFTGSTICYAYMQSAGLVNDHLIRCFRRAQLRDLAE